MSLMIFQRTITPKLEQYLSVKEIIVLTGMRRVGKTTLLKHLFNKVESTNKIMLDVGSPIVRSYFEELDYDNIWANLRNLGINKSQKSYIFLDEIQDMPEITKAIKYLYDHYDVKFVVTGSSSYYLKNLFPESLAGRKFVFELHPLNFEEFLVFKGINKRFSTNLDEIAQTKNKIDYEINKSFYNEYLEWGGFPEVVLEDNPELKKLKIEDIFKAYFEKDVKGLASFSDLPKFRDLMLLLIQRIGTKLDISKLGAEIEITRPTVYSYLSFLESTYFLSLVKPYSKSVDREVSGASKIYICDTGLINILGKVNEGSILENSVYINLRKYGKINYYEKRKGGEVDFIIDQKTALEVKTKATMKYISDINRKTKTLNLENHYIISRMFVNNPNVIIAQDL